VESNYESRAVSPKGAMGLMQLMPATARQYALVDPFDPAQNLDAGLRHLRGLLDRYGKGRESLALAAYNAGEGAVTRYRGIPPFRETQDYVRRILTLTGR
jgi:soluble lytic murein transglycosylase-like protein